MGRHMPDNYNKFIAEKGLISTCPMDQFDFLVKPNAAASASERDEDTATNSTALPGGGHNEDDEGFKTPTSPHQMIPLAIEHCPPAPRKPRAIPARAKIRKASGRGRRLHLDLSDEVEALFPHIIRKNFRRMIEPTKVPSSEENVENKLS